MDTNKVDIDELIQQAEVLYSAGNYEKSIEYLKKAEQENPMQSEIYFAEGRSYIMLDQYDKAKEVFSKVLLIDKNNAETYFHLGNIAFLKDENEKGREYYAKAINKGFHNIELYFNLATVFEEMRDYENAVKNYNKVIAMDQFRVEAKFRKAQIYIMQKEYKKAIQTLDSMIETNPDVFEGYHYKVGILIELKDFEGAEKTLNKAMKAFPDDMGIQFDLIHFYGQKGMYDKALQYIEKYFKNTDNIEIKKEKAKILIVNGNLEDGIAILEEIKNNPQIEFNAEIIYLLFNIYALMGEQQKTIAYCNEIIEKKEENKYYFSAIYFRAESYNKLNMEKEAVELFEEASEILKKASSKHPEVLDLYIYRALIYKGLKNNNKALEMVDYVLAVNADVAEAYIIRADIYKEMGFFDKSEKEKNIAISKNNLFTYIIN